MAKNDLTEKQLSSQTVYQGDLLHVNEDQVQLPNGNTSRREYILHPGAVVIIPLLENGHVIMERQFRYPLHRDVYELPAGKLDACESALVCGQRELMEETGYSAASWKYVATIHPCIGYSNERMSLFLAQELTEGIHQRDGDEFIEVFTLPMEEALEWVRTGRITDVKTVIGLFWAEKILDGWLPPEIPASDQA
ncbi:MAG: NUDIX hydrolase [Sulfurimicrobium sp.]|nr:NUDIX hydrolase [Sulfurimicrobium sp.]MDP2198586.1 NUDIX hydrolase [Sulfurimicrobium sp.]MDP3686205.1 NUDIX hydrolase [Sulfurimicrobium sp.]